MLVNNGVHNPTHSVVAYDDDNPLDPRPMTGAGWATLFGIVICFGHSVRQFQKDGYADEEDIDDADVEYILNTILSRDPGGSSFTDAELKSEIGNYAADWLEQLAARLRKY